MNYIDNIYEKLWKKYQNNANKVFSKEDLEDATLFQFALLKHQVKNGVIT
ncbi:MAG: hypothetical protein U9Q83_07230 [Bacteroidota bacterium]|nr:hypothetical protein [Bacteroidota bacterium]